MLGNLYSYLHFIYKWGLKFSSRITLQPKVESIDQPGTNVEGLPVPEFYDIDVRHASLCLRNKIKKNIFILHYFPEPLLAAAGQRGEASKGPHCPWQPLGTLSHSVHAGLLSQGQGPSPSPLLPYSLGIEIYLQPSEEKRSWWGVAAATPSPTPASL